MSGVFNNLVMYKQDVPQNSMRSIVPELATSWDFERRGTAVMLLDAPAAKGFPSFSVFHRWLIAPWIRGSSSRTSPRGGYPSSGCFIPVISIGRADILPLLLLPRLPLVSLESVQSAQRAAQTLSWPSLRHILWTPFNRMS